MSILDTAEYRRLALIAAGVDPSQIPCILDTATWRRLMLAALYDLSQGGGGSPGYINGSVRFYADLPVTAGTPAVNTAYLVRENSGVWFINRRPAGIYVRLFNFGNLDDWDYAGAFPEVNDSQYFRIYDSADPTKEIAFSASGITAGATRTLTVPNASGTLALTTTPPALHASTHAIAVHASFTGVVAGMGTTAVIRADNGGTIGNSVVLTFNGLAELFTVIGDWNSNNPSNTITLVSGNTADVPDNGETITLTGGINGGSDAVTPASIGAAVIGTGADNAQGAQRGVLTKGNFETFEINEFNNAIFKTSNTGDGCIGIETYTGAARTGFCLLGSRGANAFMQGGSSTFRIEKSGGTLADLNASRVVAASGTLTASAPVLDLAQTWNNSGVTFTGLRVNVTTIGGGFGNQSLLQDWRVDNASMASVSAFGGIVCRGLGTVASGAVSVNSCYSLHGPAGGVMEIRQGATPIDVRIHGQYTSTTNFERLSLKYNSTATAFQIGTEKGSGGGTERALQFQTDGVTRMTIATGGGVTTSAGITVGNSGLITQGNGSSLLFGRLWRTFSSSAPMVISSNQNILEIFNDQSVASGQTLRLYNNATSATNFERLNLRWASNELILDTEAGSVGGTLRGIKIGSATSSLLGFYGVTPVDQPATVTDPTGVTTDEDVEARTAINAIIDRLQEVGLIA